MRRTAFVQKLNVRYTGWWSASCASAANGFDRLGYNVQAFQSDKIEELPLAKTRPVRGSIYSVRKALELLGVPQPENIDIPDVLKPFAGREIWGSTMGTVRKKKERVFIKPLLIQKGFEGHIFNSNKERSFTRELPRNYKVLCQEPVKWIKEWRVYILHGKIVRVCHYDNFPLPTGWTYKKMYNLRPDYSTIRKMLSALGKKAPAGFALDVGVMKDKKGTFLVEMNDGFSIGNYGIHDVTFAKIIEARWKELVNRK